jgi:hypothetical protein
MDRARLPALSLPARNRMSGLREARNERPSKDQNFGKNLLAVWRGFAKFSRL